MPENGDMMYTEKRYFMLQKRYTMENVHKTGEEEKKMRERIYLNRGWQFKQEYDEALLHPEYTGEYESVELPHTVVTTPFHYFDESIYQMVSGYRKVIFAKNEWREKQVRLTVEAAAHQAEVYINGVKIKEHDCGYTAFSVDLAPYLKWEEENVLVIRVDSRESLNQPPFGKVIDYMTYGGIYREVYLDVLDKTYIEDVFIKTKRLSATEYELSAEIDCLQLKDDVVKVTLLDGETTLGELVHPWQSIQNITEWHPEHPKLYTLHAELIRGIEVVDCVEVRFGFREAVFREDGFYLNGEKFKLRGLNRHQSYPYVGYAMPESVQKFDADLIKEELGLNAVRTSHYPQSQHFIDRCDELGLLVFTEIPGWQFVGGEEWKQKAIKNTEDMVLQYRNHPSIILWGVRINESMDVEDFYKETNRVAHELDETRQTSGVRFVQKSQLLEDVYAYNDFSHSGANAGCVKKKVSTPNVKKGYLISEYNGHMFPTKSFDSEDHVTEHMLRHARVMNAYYGEPDIAGGFGWCMFDYNTHKDFGSGDRICYHGVMDMFRNKKLAGDLYYAQQDKEPVLRISSSMDIGEHEAGMLKEIYAVTNADSVRIYKNNKFVTEMSVSKKEFGNLPHGPIRIDDFVGELLETEEHFPKKKARDIKKVLLAANRYGMANLPFGIKLLAAKCMIAYRMKLSDAVDLYGKYIGNWGGNVITYRFEAIRDREVVKVVEKKPMTKRCLQVTCSHTELKEKTTYDVAAIRFKMESEIGNLLPFCNDVVTLQAEGDIAIIGPDNVPLRGGMGGTYVKTLGREGNGKLTLSCDGVETVIIEFSVTMANV